MASYNAGTPVQAFGVTAGGDPEKNRQRLQDAISYVDAASIRDEYASAPDLVFPVADEPYVFDGDIIINRNIIIAGAGAVGRTINGVNLRFTSNARAGFFLPAPGGRSAVEPYRSEIGEHAFSAGRSILRNLDIQPVDAGGVDFGIVHNVPATFDHVRIKRFRRAGFFAHGQTEGGAAYGDPNGVGGKGSMWGNTNGSLYLKCVAEQQTEGHGFVAQGNNTQIMTYLNCDASTNNGCGFRDNSAIGNHYICCHTAKNTFKVEHGGTCYMPIKPHIAAAENKPGTGQEWRRYWVAVRATIPDEHWTSGKAYRDAGGINVVDDRGSYSMIFSHYTEGGIEFGVIPRANATVIGGVAGGGRIYRGPEATNVNCVGTALSDTPARWRGGDLEGTHKWGSALGSQVHNPDFFEAGHSDDPDVKVAGKSGIKISYSTIRHAYEFLKGTATHVFSITAEGWKKGAYVGPGHAYFENGVILGGVASARLRAAPSLEALPTGLRVETGEVFVLTSAKPGGHAFAIVTTGGEIGADAVVKYCGKIDL